MKFKTFNTTNVINAREQKPSIGINSKVGLFNFNKAACESIGLKDGDQVQFHQNEDDETEWFLEKVKKDGFILREKTNVTSGLLFNSTALARKIFDSVTYTGVGGKVIVGENVTVDKKIFHTLVTASLRNS